MAGLLAIGTEEKLDAFDAGARFLLSARGKTARDQLVAELMAAGYPEPSARKEVDLLPMVLSRGNLEAVVDNSAVLPGGKALLDGQFVPLSPNVTASGFPVGPVLVIGSGNAFIPAVVAVTHALLANCPVALRGSRLNQKVLERLVQSLRSGGGPTLQALLERLHLFFVDHRDPEENRQLRNLLRTGPFGAGVFWGGRDMLDTLLPEFARNPRHPVAIPMEPLTGVAFLTQRYVTRTHHASTEAAHDLSEAMTLFGQQLCSSPTEAYFVGDRGSVEVFAAELAGELARSGEARTRVLSDAQAVLLNRVRDRCEEYGSTVLTPPRQASGWTVVVSTARSVFAQFPPGLVLPISERHGFLELIAVSDINGVADHIASLPAAPCHAAIRQVQTILRFAHLPDAQRLVGLLRERGGVYRVVPPDHVGRRHPLEPFDGQHLVSLFTRQTVVL